MLSAARGLTIGYRPVASLKPDPRNARTHPKRQIEQIVGSIREFGFTNPVLIDEDGGLIAAHGRLRAAKELGLAEVPAITLPGLTEVQKKALRLADKLRAILRIGTYAHGSPEFMRCILPDDYAHGRRNGLRLALAVLAAEEAKWSALLGESPSWRTNATREVRYKTLRGAQKRVQTVLGRLTPKNGELIDLELAAALDMVGL